MEENPCGKRKRKGKRWRAAYSGARRSSAFQIGRPSQDFHAALRCTRPLPSPFPGTGVACLTDGIQYDGISVVDRRPAGAEFARAEVSAAFRLRPSTAQGKKRYLLPVDEWAGFVGTGGARPVRKVFER